jgi:DNA-binding NtrC family response regulator
MQVRLLIALADEALTTQLARLSRDAELQVQIAAPGQLLGESGNPADADFVLADGHELGRGAAAAAAIAAIRAGASRPEFLFLATDESADDRAAALAAGCLAVLDSGAAASTLEKAVRRLVRAWRDKAVLLLEADQGGASFRLGDFVSHSPAMARFMKVARRVADSASSVLILGETGVGKERLANAIHAEGQRSLGPFVVVNCGAIPESLIESELFGHEKGSFTGAHRIHRGFFEMAHGGTIFLDEIGELPLHVQVKLLRVLQEKEVQRVGSEVTIPVDIRLIAATNRDLKAEMEASRFRSDLYYRLSVVNLTIPPLRDRVEDIPRLVESYLERFRIELGVSAQRVSAAAMRALQTYTWPGNVREVINVIERATLLCDGEVVTLDELPDDIAGVHLTDEDEPVAARAGPPLGQLDANWVRMPLGQAKRAWSAAFERAYLEQLLRETTGRINETAQRAGIDPRSLYDKMRRHHLRKEDYKG